MRSLILYFIYEYSCIYESSAKAITKRAVELVSHALKLSDQSLTGKGH
jgi:hypothetical protein